MVSENDVAALIKSTRLLLSYMPCNVQRGTRWVDAWEALSEDDRNSIIEAASIASDTIDRIEEKSKDGGKNVRQNKKH